MDVQLCFSSIARKIDWIMGKSVSRLYLRCGIESLVADLYWRQSLRILALKKSKFLASRTL